MPWISNFLVKQFGWQAALQLLGGFIIVLALPFALMVKDAPLHARLSASSSSADIRSALKSLPFALLGVGSMCSIAAVSGTQQNLKLFLSLDRHYSQSNAAQVISPVLAFSIVGRILMGWLADRFPTIRRSVWRRLYLCLSTVAIGSIRRQRGSKSWLLVCRRFLDGRTDRATFVVISRLSTGRRSFVLGWWCPRRWCSGLLQHRNPHPHIQHCHGSAKALAHAARGCRYW